MVTNQERIREFRGKTMHVFGGGTFSAVNLHVHVMNFTVDALATVAVTLKDQNFAYDGMFNNYTLYKRCSPYYRGLF